MKIKTWPASGIIKSTLVVALSICSSVFPLRLEAQGSQGQNAVCPSASACSSSNAIGSNAFIDASMFALAPDTFCSTIYKILQVATYSPAVIDARGLPGATGPA
jgi:hypothetical protein